MTDLKEKVQDLYSTLDKGGKGKEDEVSVEEDEDIDLYIRNMNIAGQILTDPFSTVEAKKTAILNIGYNAYAGGQNGAGTSVQYLPHLCSAFTLPHNEVFIIPALQALSQMAIKNRPLKDFFLSHTATLTAMVNLINSQDTSTSRWACYVLIRLIANNLKLQNQVIKIPKVKEALDHAATNPVPWIGWGENIAEILLQMLRFEEVDPHFS